MRVAVGADHAGFEMKRDLAAQMAQQGHEILDVGTHSSAAVDYPDIAEAVATAIRNGQVDRGIIVCGSGAGVSVAANKFPGVRAAVCHDAYTARQAVEHDDLNVMCLGARVLGPALARTLVEVFLAATFSAEDRHLRRLAKIDAIESKFSHE
jgi:ribose 5-phosphate isomerase B